tara:strand:+ start:16649 stop:17560 length:912 start_codon:yes stop_codon:yes gene_type:complete
MNKILNISIDVDNIHHYLRARNYKPTESTNLNSIYDFAIPRMLDIFDEYGVKSTFFIVGEDAIKHPLKIKEIVDRGHEISNHTYNHFQNFLYLEKKEKEFEILECKKVLEDISGQEVIGFRAPGWNIDKVTMNILHDNGFKYDSSVFPSYFNPIINFVNILTNKGKISKSLGVDPKLGFASKKPYYPKIDKIWKKGKQRNILEIPPTVVPILNFPWLGSTLYKLGKPTFNLSKYFVDQFRDIVLYQLHAIETVDHVEVNDNRLSVKPGFNLPIEKKIDLYHHFIKSFKNYNFKTLKEIAFTIQ